MLSVCTDSVFGGRLFAWLYVCETNVIMLLWFILIEFAAQMTINVTPLKPKENRRNRGAKQFSADFYFGCQMSAVKPYLWFLIINIGVVYWKQFYSVDVDR